MILLAVLKSTQVLGLDLTVFTTILGIDTAVVLSRREKSSALGVLTESVRIVEHYTFR